MSLFKSAMYYRINNQDAIDLFRDPAQLEEALSAIPEAMPTGSQWRKLGFTSPFPGYSENLVWTAQDYSVFMLATHERDLKGVTIKEHIAAKVRTIEEREQRKCYRKEVAQIRDDVEAALLPKAFIKHSYTMAMVIGDMLIIDSSSAKKSEDLLDYLRDALGQLSVRPLTLKIPLADAMTGQVQGRNTMGSRLAILSQAKLVNSLKASVSFKDCALTDDEPQEYIEQGFKVTELAMSLNDGTVEQFRFRINDQAIVKGIKFSDFVLDPIKADADGDQAALVDGSLILIRKVLLDLAGELVDNLGEDRIPVTPAEPEQDSDDIRDLVVEHLIAHGDASVSAVQRVARIGYSRAARLLEELEDDCLVTAPDSHGRREVIGFIYDSGASSADLQKIAQQAQDLVDGKDTGLKIGGLTVDLEKTLGLSESQEDDDDDWSLSTTPADEDDEL